jgi:hypothetical protein
VRIAFFILLCANLAFLAWSQWIDVPDSAGRADPTARLPRLKMAGESAGPATPPTAEAPQKPAVTALCVSVGPFDDASSASRGVDMLKKKGFPSHARPEQGAPGDVFWVYVGSLSTDEAAAAGLQKINDGGLSDARLMQPTHQERRITVGMFTTRDGANQRREAIRRIGLKADIGEHRVPATRYWVDVAVKSEGSTVPAQDLYRGPASKIGAQPCPAGTPPPTAYNEGAAPRLAAASP